MCQFIEGNKYTGEVFYGGCGCMDTVSITVQKRHDDSITFEEKFGNTTIRVAEASIQSEDSWSEYIGTADDRFFAYADYV
ncbi:hypothetical protein NB640_10370 [Oxalobacter vibrioformis]|uniref:Uncharacterized protein n=1 Tax=Oxalobacter vibrioformis TaxID=933080 RepID=A0A9E9LWM5_9BURK|nr:hypothetical protein [Oxalobacter vibrioformis]WAW09626.1 hypothetical protein NB640_10370 [Oxalobacter vibrioformis]